MLYAENGTTTLVTAKHNLFMLAGDADPPAWSQNLVTSFQQRVSIYYDANMAYNSPALRSAPISTVTPVTPNTAAAVGLRRHDPGVHRRQPGVSSPPTTRSTAPNYNAQDQNYPAQRQSVPRAQQPDLRADRLRHQPRACRKPGQDADAHGPGWHQHLRPVAVPRGGPGRAALAARFSGSTANPGQYQQYIDTAQFSADPNTSSSEGDSGGGLFVYSANSGTPRLFLIGVTTGADMALAQTPCPTPPALRVNNIVTSLEYCYRNGLLGY